MRSHSTSHRFPPDEQVCRIPLGANRLNDSSKGLFQEGRTIVRPSSPLNVGEVETHARDASVRESAMEVDHELVVHPRTRTMCQHCRNSR